MINSLLIANIIINVSVLVSGQVNWNGNWAMQCDFNGNDLTNARVAGAECGGLCSRTNGCTHFVWTSHLGGTCWMKKGSVSKNDAFKTNDGSMVCGIIIESATGSNTNTNNNNNNNNNNNAGSSNAAAFHGCKFRAGRLYTNEWADYSQFDYISIWLGTIENQNTDFNPWYQGMMIETCKKQNKIPLFYAYIIAFEARKEKGIDDCDVQQYWNYCYEGANYIRERRQHLIDRYSHQAYNIAQKLGRDGVAVFVMEPDFWQYYGDWRQKNGGLSGEYMRDLFNDFVKAIKTHLPNALISWDISAWIGEEGFRKWWSFFKDSQIDFIHTSGGQAEGQNANLKPGELTWRFVSQVTGKRIIADCGYGVAGHDSSNCWPWFDQNIINNRVSDGVIAITQASDFKNVWYRPNVC